MISFATPPYAGHLQRLVESLVRFELPYRVEVVPDLGSWERNCNRKPGFVLDCLQRLSAPVLWLDADAEVMQYPGLLEAAEFDFAICDRPGAGSGPGRPTSGPARCRW